ncbi:hypothetical protein JW707_01295 [Candidatus Woesearchaeota archaeon]|nr:hypothetical protein [Candidatus Woesearchaeota archaeon]
MDKLYFGTTRVYYEKLVDPAGNLVVNNVWASASRLVAQMRAVYKARAYRDEAVMVTFYRNPQAVFESAGEEHFRVTGVFSQKHHEISDLCMEMFRINKKERKSQPDMPEDGQEAVNIEYAMLFAPRDSEDFFRELRLRNSMLGDS